MVRDSALEERRFEPLVPLATVSRTEFDMCRKSNQSGMSAPIAYPYRRYRVSWLQVAIDRSQAWTSQAGQTGGTQNHQPRHCTLAAARSGLGHEGWFLPESLNGGRRSSKETSAKTRRAASETLFPAANDIALVTTPPGERPLE